MASDRMEKAKETFIGKVRNVWLAHEDHLRIVDAAKDVTDDDVTVEETLEACATTALKQALTEAWQEYERATETSVYDERGPLPT